MSVVHLYFGIPAGAVWSNLVASVICAGVVWWRLRARLVVQHAEQLAQGARHHRERIAQDEADHKAVMLQAERHQQELLTKADGMHEAMKVHVSAVAAHVAVSSVQVPQQVIDDIKAASKKSGGLKPGERM